MRLTLSAIGLALVLASVSSAGHGQRRNNVVNPRSAALVAQARIALVGGQLEAANDALETALAIDPDNLAAFKTLAEVALRQNLPGKAFRLYREALAVEPNDTTALAGQGEALVAKGAMTKARENLARIKTLCVGTCPESARLTASIDRGPPPVVKSAQIATPAAKTP